MRQYEELFRDEYDGLVLYFTTKLSDPALAEDLAMESFAQLIQAGDEVDEPEALLRTIAKRRLVDTIRKREAAPEFLSWEALGEDEEALVAAGLVYNLTDDDRDESVVLVGEKERAAFRAKFDEAVRRLDPIDRDAFILTELRGLDTTEAGELLDLDQTRVSRRASAARAQIRKELLAA